MREFIIQEDDANQRVDKFLQKTLPALPKSLMYKYIRNKKIKGNRTASAARRSRIMFYCRRIF